MHKKNYRGYQGRYKQYYYRSFIEFIYIKYLEKNNIKFKQENKIIETPFGKYKNDFMLLNSKELIEIKDNNFIVETNDKIKWLIDNKIIKIIYRKDLVRFFTKKELLDFKKYVKENDDYLSINPMFGLKHSDIAKKKIGKKTKERMMNKEFKKFHSDRMKEKFLNTDYVATIKNAAILRGRKQKEFNYLCYIKNPKKCLVCNNIISFENKKRNTCSKACKSNLTKININKKNISKDKKIINLILDKIKKKNIELTTDLLTNRLGTFNYIYLIDEFCLDIKYRKLLKIFNIKTNDKDGAKKFMKILNGDKNGDS